jgi:hypothetical protein
MGELVPISGPSGGWLSTRREDFVPVSKVSLLRRRREKVFGRPRGTALDRNAKARIVAFAKAYNARHRQPGQHRGPLTRATLEVLEALLWGFHNSKSGACFPSYETIAAKAECCRDTVYQAIKALELAGILSWVHRLVRVRFRERDPFGQMVSRCRVIRTSNAYQFQDTQPKAVRQEARKTAEKRQIPSKSENRSETQTQDLLESSLSKRPVEIPVLNLGNELRAVRKKMEERLLGTRLGKNRILIRPSMPGQPMPGAAGT